MPEEQKIQPEAQEPKDKLPPDAVNDTATSPTASNVHEETTTPAPDQPGTIEPQPIEMDVHHHTHTPRKKWTHYLFEFFMLFLAVFCGFIAENFREHIVENGR